MAMIEASSVTEALGRVGGTETLDLALLDMSLHIVQRLLEAVLKPPCPRCGERSRDARKSDEATNVAEE